MVEKPREGLCANCESDRLDFYDDGSGMCLNCGRTFRWDLEEQKEKEQPIINTKNTTFLNISMFGFALTIIGFVLMSFLVMRLNIFQNVIEIMRGLVILFIYTGVILISTGLVYGSATAEHLDDKIRAWMLIAMAILLGLFLTFSVATNLAIFFS
ncbi:MAG: hypothetical protein ACOC85_01090 [Thermoplasmatota archaeon]